MFAQNEAQHGLKTNFSMDQYSEPIAAGAMSRAEADRIAKEIESEKATNWHVAEERGQVDDSGITEEERYGAVARQPAGRGGGGAATGQAAGAQAPSQDRQDVNRMRNVLVQGKNLRNSMPRETQRYNIDASAVDALNLTPGTGSNQHLKGNNAAVASQLSDYKSKRTGSSPNTASMAQQPAPAAAAAAAAVPSPAPTGPTPVPMPHVPPAPAAAAPQPAQQDSAAGAGVAPVQARASGSAGLPSQADRKEAGERVRTFKFSAATKEFKMPAAPRSASSTAASNALAGRPGSSMGSPRQQGQQRRNTPSTGGERGCVVKCVHCMPCSVMVLPLATSLLLCTV